MIRKRFLAIVQINCLTEVVGDDFTAEDASDLIGTTLNEYDDCFVEHLHVFPVGNYWDIASRRYGLPCYYEELAKEESADAKLIEN